MHLKQLLNEVNRWSDDKDKNLIPKGDDFFKTPKQKGNYKFDDIQDVITHGGYTINVYHNNSHGENHVLAQFKERITDGTGTYNKGPLKDLVIKDHPNWKSYKPSVLKNVIRKAIYKIHKEIGLYDEEDSLNDYLIIDKATHIMLRMMITNMFPDMKNKTRQVLITTILFDDMQHDVESSYDQRLNNKFIDFEMVILEGKGGSKFIVLYV